MGHVVVLRMERGRSIEALDENIRADNEAYKKVERDNPPDLLVDSLSVRFAEGNSSVVQSNNKPYREEKNHGWSEEVAPRASDPQGAVNHGENGISRYAGYRSACQREGPI